jgi:hypothetical protein
MESLAREQLQNRRQGYPLLIAATSLLLDSAVILMCETPEGSKSAAPKRHIVDGSWS